MSDERACKIIGAAMEVKDHKFCVGFLKDLKLYNRFAILYNVRLRLTQEKEIPILSS